MRAWHRKTLVPTLAVSLVLVTPEAVLGQSLSSRPASVALTVVVPPRELAVPPRELAELTTIEHATLHGSGDAARDVQAVIGIANRPASRIEVRLGADWASTSARVLVQNRAGDFEPLASATRTVAATVPASAVGARSRLRFRLESERPLATIVSIPIEYRVTIGEGDQIAIWTFPSVLQVGGKP
jgi:hypothetical protein